jgi:hypothetical protein
VSDLSAARLRSFALCAWIAALCVALLDVPFLSEDYTHLAEAGARPLLSAFDLTREPLRPLQHLFFQVLALWSDPSPARRAWSRSPSTSASVRSCTRWRASSSWDGARRAFAALLFALFPNVKGLAWSAAISTPGRSFFVLLAFLAFLRWRRRAARSAALLVLVAFVLALGFHENAIVLPALLLAWACASGAGAVRELLRRPLVGALTAGALAYVIYLAFLRPERHHGLKSLESLPANVIKAALCTFPEVVRANVVNFLRAHPGGVGTIAGASLLALLALGAALVWTRAQPVARFAVLAVLIDLALPTIGAGFNQRYAYLSAAWIALALGAWAAQSARARILAWILGLAWAFDSVVDLAEYRAAGQIARHELQQACAARERVGPERTLVIVDPTDVWGRERDIPVFNWGLSEALERARCPGPWRFWRTRDFATGTAVERVSEAQIRAAAEQGEVLLLIDR